MIFSCEGYFTELALLIIWLFGVVCGWLIVLAVITLGRILTK
jgi:hypothetical protein